MVIWLVMGPAALNSFALAFGQIYGLFSLERVSHFLEEESRRSQEGAVQLAKGVLVFYFAFCHCDRTLHSKAT